MPKTIQQIKATLERNIAEAERQFNEANGRGDMFAICRAFGYMTEAAREAATEIEYAVPPKATQRRSADRPGIRK